MIKGDYFKKSSNEVPDVTLPGDEDGFERNERNPAQFEDEEKPKSPPSATLKQEIYDLERTEDESNLYSIYKPKRMTRRERDDSLESFLHPDL